MSDDAPMTGPQVRALLALQAACAASHDGTAMPGEVARLLWPYSYAWQRRPRMGRRPGSGARMGAVAARLLWKLDRRRLAVQRHGLWRLTHAGVALARQLMETTR
jgi:hypothetical protein